MLHTLGFRIPTKHVDSLLGQVATYPWDTNFADAWKRLPRTPRKGGAPTRPAYRQLQTGLTAAHGHPVKILDSWQLGPEDQRAGVQGLILTSNVIKPFVLSTCLRTFERQLHKGADPNTLAPALPTADTTRAFRDVITVAESGTAIGPGWLFESAVWAVMARLATRSLRLEDDGPKLKLRMDTDGSLLAWKQPVSNQWGDYTGYAMLRVTASIINLPRVADLVITFDAHLSRINEQWRGAKNTWIERGNAALPILRVPIRNVRPDAEGGQWSTEVANHAAAIAEACGMESLDLDQQLPPAPGRFRPLVPGPRAHPVGKGPGARVMLRLAEHIERTCPLLEPLSWVKSKHTKVKAPRRQMLTPPTSQSQEKAVRVTPDVITAAVTSAGTDGLRLLCLYATSEARQRMTTQLQSLARAAAPAIDNHVSAVSEHLAVSFHRMPDLLAHGSRDRAELAGDIEAIAKAETGAVVAWVETEYDPKTGKAKDDAKRPVRRVLAQLGIASQFLATPPPPQSSAPVKAQRPRRAKKSTATDHRAMAAAADLILRTTGVLHPDIAREILHDFLDGTAHESVHLVGLHSRLQQSSTDKEPSKLVLTATDIHAHRDPDRPWPIRMWTDTARKWIAQPIGIAAFHAATIGSDQRGRRGDKAVATRLYIESILSALPAGPVVLFVDTQAFRAIYPGLQNHHFGAGALPAINLSAQRDIAIVRCNTSDEVPRPVNRRGGNTPGDPRQPAAPDGYVYQLEGKNVWLFPKKSRLYKAKGGATGARYTPWNLPENLSYLIGEDWHSYNGTEICVPQTGIWPARALVTLTARLCDHTIVWDDRTIAPMPLHLATRADKTHPDFRGEDESSG